MRLINFPIAAIPRFKSDYYHTLRDKSHCNSLLKSAFLGMPDNEQNDLLALISISKSLIIVVLLLLVTAGLLIWESTYQVSAPTNQRGPVIPDAAASSPLLELKDKGISSAVWTAPDTSTINSYRDAELIHYGRQLIVHTSSFLGPVGTVAHISNGMNCENCHLDAGSRLFANNFATFIASYPKYSARSGRQEDAVDRIDECFERSLNGRAPAKNSREMRAILAYMKWIGQGVHKGEQLPGKATEKLPFLARAANPMAGKAIYATQCQSCHGDQGQGVLAADKRSYQYPPLWGAHSYNDGAGMYRLINFAGFVKNNMPFGATKDHPQLSNEQAWDVAAFVNSQPRPHKNQQGDYPNPDEKPVDLAIPPFSDHFSIDQHKYGPFSSINQAHKNNKN